MDNRNVVRRNRRILGPGVWIIVTILAAATISGIGSVKGRTGEVIADVVTFVAGVAVVLIVPTLRATFREMLGHPSPRSRSGQPGPPRPFGH
jgi:hypothetical protein